MVTIHQIWLGFYWQQSTSWDTFYKQTTHKHWMCAGCNQRKLAVDSMRIRRSGDPMAFSENIQLSWISAYSSAFIRVFWQNISSTRYVRPPSYQFRFGSLWLLAFSKDNIAFDRETISGHGQTDKEYDKETWKKTL